MGAKWTSSPRLHQQVVDLLACHDHTDWMIQDVENRLGAASYDLIDDVVNELTFEASRQPVSGT